MTKYMDEEVVIKKVVEILLRELGPMETTRFFAMSGKRRMDSVRRHLEWQKKLDKDSFFNDVFPNNGK
jgi:hypothetical protein